MEQPAHSDLWLDIAAVNTKEDFARLLDALRLRARLSNRDLNKETGISISTLGDYFRGTHLPRDAATLALILRACGVTDEEVVNRWVDAFGRVRVSPGPRPTSHPAPYMGLKSYQPEDAEWFFGREALTSMLCQRLIDQVQHGRGVLIVVGPSGSGKSSVLRAGMIPAVERGVLSAIGNDWSVVLLTPGDDPLFELARRLGELHRVPAAEIAADLRCDPASIRTWTALGVGQNILMVIDQFEDIFTICQEDTERQAFIQSLWMAASGTSDAGPSAGSKAAVVIGLRADYYADLLRSRVLAQVAVEAQVVVEPMEERDLRNTIAGPAEKAKLKIDKALIELILRDLQPTMRRTRREQTYDVGSLPLLSHALLMTWKGSRGAHMTIADYQGCGGVDGAIARTADDHMASLDETQRDLARRLLLNLVHLSDEAVARRRVRLTDLRASFAAEQEAMDQVLVGLAHARLITVDTETVEIVHDALLSAWPKLHDWIEADRDGLRIRQRLEEDAASWSRDGKSPDALYRGGRLSLAREWIGSGCGQQISAAAAMFYATSLKLETARRRRSYQMIAGFALITIVAITATIVALHQRDVTANQRDLADSRMGAARADRMRDTDPSLATQLSISAYQISKTPEALSSVLNSSATPAATRLLGGTGTVHAVTYTPDARTLISGNADGSLHFWNIADPKRPKPGVSVQGSTDAVTTVAVSGDGHTLASSGYDKTVHLWTISDTQPATEVAALKGPGAIVNSLAFGGTRILAAGGADASTWLWDVADPRNPSLLTKLADSDAGVNAVTFNDKSSLLAVGSADNIVRIWNVANPRQPTLLTKMDTSTAAVNTIAFSRDGQMLAAGSSDTIIRLWDIRDPSQPHLMGKPLVGAASRIYSVVFSPDNSKVAAGSADDTARIWDIKSGGITATLPHPGPVTAVAFGTDSSTLATGASDGITRIWKLPTPILAGSERSVFTVAFNRDGHLLAAGNGDGTINIWDTANPWQMSPVAALSASGESGSLDGTVAFGPDGRLAAGGNDGSVQLWRSVRDSNPQTLRPEDSKIGYVESVAFNSDGGLLASSHSSGRIQLWSTENPLQPQRLATLSTAPGLTALSVTFHPTARILAAASADKTVWLWDIENLNRPIPLGRPLTGPTNYVYHVAFSPDGHLLAAGSADGRVYLWDMTNPRQPIHFGPPLAGPKGYVYAVAFTPDSQRLATANTDKTVWLWDLASQRPSNIAVLTGATKSLFSVSISPNGRTLAASGQDQMVRVWNTDPEEIIVRACSALGDPITRTEWSQYFPDRPYNPPCQFRT